MCFSTIVKYIKLLKSIFIIYSYRILFVATYYFTVCYSILRIQSSPFVVSPKYSVNPPTRSTNSYPALQVFTCYRVSPVTLSDFGGPDGGSISGLDCISNIDNNKPRRLTRTLLFVNEEVNSPANS